MPTDSDPFAETDNHHPWHRQRWIGTDGLPHIETVQAHSAFKAFLQMNENRSVTAVAKQLSKSRALCSRWSSRWRWMEQAKLYDNYADAELANTRIPGW